MAKRVLCIIYFFSPRLTFVLLTHSFQSHLAHRLIHFVSLSPVGSDRRFELTPVAAISVHLLGSDGAELHVSEPISVSFPLPANSGLKENDHIPAWRFDPKLGEFNTLRHTVSVVQDIVVSHQGVPCFVCVCEKRKRPSTSVARFPVPFIC